MDYLRAKWWRNDQRLIFSHNSRINRFLAEVAAWSNSFVGLGHNKRMAKNIAAKEALKSKPQSAIFSRNILISKAYDAKIYGL